MKTTHSHRLGSILLAVALGLGLGLTVQAADRALLVGVGQYRDASANLDGIDLDLDMMRDLATLMGFTDLTVLQDAQATYANVRAALAQLIEQTRDGDRALFYFSGHGAQVKDQNGDEEDGLDEVLVLHDTVLPRGGELTDNILIDDEIGALIAQLRGGELYLMIDACHSGTSSKSARMVQTEATAFFSAREAQKKGLGNLGVAAKAPGAVARDAPSTARYASLAAARDHQSSLATVQGSLFTLGLREALVAAKPSGGITLEELLASTTAFVAQNTTPDRRFEPELQGNPDLFGKAIRLEQVGEHGRLWARFEELVRRSGNVRMVLTTDAGARIKTGDYFTLTLDLPVAGYLSVVAVDSGDENPVVLFPNAWMGETRFDAGRVTLPPSPDADWGLMAADPSKTLMVAIVTPTPLNLYADGVRKDRVDLDDQVFARLAPGAPSLIEKTTRAPGAVARTAAARIVVDFVK